MANKNCFRHIVCELPGRKKLDTYGKLIEEGVWMHWCILEVEEVAKYKMYKTVDGDLVVEYVTSHTTWFERLSHGEWYDGERGSQLIATKNVKANKRGRHSNSNNKKRWRERRGLIIDRPIDDNYIF